MVADDGLAGVTPGHHRVASRPRDPRDWRLMAVNASEPSDLEQRKELIERIRVLVGVLIYVPRMWLIAVLAAAALSTFTAKREGGDWSVTFEVTTATIVILALIWLPTLLRIFMAVGTGVKAFGVEVTGGGIASLLDRFEPSGTFLHPPAQGEVAEREAPGFEHDFGEAEWEAPAEAPGLPSRLPAPPDWTFKRDEIYAEQRNIFLAHRIKPSPHPNQKYDVSVYLVGHNQEPSDVVEQAEFFLGPYWGNQVFEVRNTGGQTIGMTTAAYGSPLCICRVTFTDGTHAILHRYLDFEMSWVFDEPPAS
jgi:hypothetical protein